MIREPSPRMEYGCSEPKLVLPVRGQTRHAGLGALMQGADIGESRFWH